MAKLSNREATENAFHAGATAKEQGLKLDLNNAALLSIISASDMPASELVNCYQQGYQDGLITF